MGSGFTIGRVGHIGVQVTDMDRSLEFYTEILGLTLTGRWPMGEEGAMAFLRFTDMHHDIVLFTHPKQEEDTNRHIGYNGLQHIAMEVENRDEWLKALADLKRKGVEIVSGPLVHGPESQPWNIGGSGTRSFYFLDPDGNSLELYCDMMKVPDGEQFPRQEYQDVFKD